MTEISQFRFNSMRKYMHPIYALLNRNLDLREQEKREFVKRTIPKFFQRLREYRNISREGMAAATGILLTDLKQFENGEPVKTSRDFGWEYLRACHAFSEFDYFSQQIREFYHPSIKGTAQDMAIDLVKKFGILLPSVDYKSLHAARGTILEFKNDGRRN